MKTNEIIKFNKLFVATKNNICYLRNALAMAKTGATIFYSHAENHSSLFTLIYGMTDVMTNDLTCYITDDMTYLWTGRINYLHI